MFRKNLGVWIGLAITINGFVFLSIQNFRSVVRPTTDAHSTKYLESARHSSEILLKTEESIGEFSLHISSEKEKETLVSDLEGIEKNLKNLRVALLESQSKRGILD